MHTFTTQGYNECPLEIPTTHALMKVVEYIEHLGTVSSYVFEMIETFMCSYLKSHFIFISNF